MYKRTATDAILTIFNALNISVGLRSRELDEAISSVHFSGKSVSIPRINQEEFLLPYCAYHSHWLLTNIPWSRCDHVIACIFSKLLYVACLLVLLTVLLTVRFVYIYIRSLANFGFLYACSFSPGTCFIWKPNQLATSRSNDCVSIQKRCVVNPICQLHSTGTYNI